MNAFVDVQIATDADQIPTSADLQTWIEAALTAANTALLGAADSCELTIRIVDEAEGRELNRDYRDRDYATNVLSFPFADDLPAGVSLPVQLLGDLVICAPVLAREAAEQGKTISAHWAHLVVHGTLHLLGYDHIEPEAADAMEALEVQVLAALGIADPYTDDEAL